MTIRFCPQSGYWRIVNLVHNRPMIWSAGDLGIEIDFGTDKPRAILQRKEDNGYQDYLVDGKPVVNPFDVESLPPGIYRLVESPVSSA